MNPVSSRGGKYRGAGIAALHVIPGYARRQDGIAISLLNMLVALRWLRITCRYHLTFGRFPNYLHPVAMSEKMQYRKLFDRNPLWILLNDKLKAREFAQGRAPEIGLPRLLWHGDDPEEMPLDRLAPPFVIKPNNRSRAILFVRRPDDIDRARIIGQCRSWLDAPPHGKASGEWAYGQIPPRIMIEECMPGQAPGSPPADYKMFVFGGRVRFIYYSAGRHEEDKAVRAAYSPDWVKLPVDKWRMKGRTRLHGEVPKPGNLEKMVEVAERIGFGIDHLRVDLYNIEGRIYLGEITPYAYSGYCTMIPDDADFSRYPPRDVDDELGALWTLPAIPLRSCIRHGLLW